ncbi:hypothetical protein QTP70_030664, partial [Hemibagrus guttatus]
GPTPPSVSLLPPSPLLLSEGSASLLCLLSGYSPQGALVSWTVDGSEVKDGVLTSAEEEKSGRYSRSSTLTLGKDLWEKGEEFICKVSLNNIIHPVSFRKTQCDGYYYPQWVLVSWTVDGSEVKNGVLTSTEEEKNGYYSCSSTLNLSKNLWEFICTVSHDNLNHPVTFRKGHREG